MMRIYFKESFCEAEPFVSARGNQEDVMCLWWNDKKWKTTDNHINCDGIAVLLVFDNACYHKTPSFVQEFTNACKERNSRSRYLTICVFGQLIYSPKHSLCKECSQFPISLHEPFSFKEYSCLVIMICIYNANSCTQKHILSTDKPTKAEFWRYKTFKWH